MDSCGGGVAGCLHDRKLWRRNFVAVDLDGVGHFTENALESDFIRRELLAQGNLEFCTLRTDRSLTRWTCPARNRAEFNFLTSTTPADAGASAVPSSAEEGSWSPSIRAYLPKLRFGPTVIGQRAWVSFLHMRMKLKNQRKNHSLFRLSGPFWTAVPQLRRGALSHLSRAAQIRVGFLLGLAELYLTVIEQTDHHNAARDIAERGRSKPGSVVSGWDSSRQDRRKDFTAVGDAMRKLAQSEHERHRPGHHSLTGRPMARGNQPSNQGQQPSSDDTAPKYRGERPGNGDCSEIDECIAQTRRQRACLYGKSGEQERTHPVSPKHNCPKLQRLYEISLFGQNQHDGVKGILGKKLRTSDNDGKESYRIYRRRNEVRSVSVAQQPGNESGGKSCQPHHQTTGYAGKPECTPRPL